LSGKTLVTLIRHGEVHNPAGVYYGRLPRFRLTPAGRAQARDAARVLADRETAAIYTSPLLRARQTAAILRQDLLGVSLQRSRLLTEVGSPFDGCPSRELAARHWDVYTGSPPGYERPEEVLNRARRFLALVRKRHAGARVVAVTHGDLIALVVLWAGSAPIRPQAMGELTRWGFPVSYPRPGSITQLCFFTADPDELPAIEHQPLP
jgi:probable phosphoglycerate mutase